MTLRQFGVHADRFQHYLAAMHDAVCEILLGQPAEVDRWNRFEATNDFDIPQAAANHGQIGADDCLTTVAWYGLTYARLHADPMFDAMVGLKGKVGLASVRPLTCLDFGSGPGTNAGALLGALDQVGGDERRVQYLAVDHNPHQLELADALMATCAPQWRMCSHLEAPQVHERLHGDLLVVTNHVWNQYGVSTATLRSWAACVARLLPDQGGHLLCIEPMGRTGQLGAFRSALADVGVHAGPALDPEHPTLRRSHRYHFGNLTRDDQLRWRPGPLRAVTRVLYRLNIEERPSR